MAWTTPRTWVAGESPSASTMNTHIRDQFNFLYTSWTTFSVTGSGNWTWNSFRYILLGPLVIIDGDFTLSSGTITAGTDGNITDVTLTAAGGVPSALRPTGNSVYIPMIQG